MCCMNDIKNSFWYPKVEQIVEAIKQESSRSMILKILSLDYIGGGGLIDI